MSVQLYFVCNRRAGHGLNATSMLVLLPPPLLLPLPLSLSLSLPLPLPLLSSSELSGPLSSSLSSLLLDIRLERAC